MNQEVKLTFTNSIKGKKKLEEYTKTLEQLKTLTETMGSNINLGSVKQGTKTMQNFGDSTNSAGEAMAKLLSFGGKTFTLAKMFDVINKGVEKTSSYVESLNLLDVAFGSADKSGMKFVNTLSEMYNLDEGTLVQTVGMFKQLANAMGIVGETGTKMSEVLTRISIDASSLYNTSFSEAVTKMQSALAGQTKAIRAYGADITQNSLAIELMNMGIEKNVANLSFAEKRLVIVSAIMRQLSNAQNDFGRTSETVSNQMKIMHEQSARLSRAFGTLFLPVVKAILPYLNAMLMVLTEILGTLGALFGIQAEDDLNGVAEVTYDLGEGLGIASTNAKKLKQGLRGFDKLNNITTPTASSSGAGAGSGLDSQFITAFNKSYKEYNDKLMKVQTKATKIRDTIMDWLGFTKQIDKETNDVSFKFDHITGGTVLGGLAVGGAIFVGVKKILNTFKALANIKNKLVGQNSKESLASGVLGGLGGGETISKKTFELPSAKTVLKGVTDLAIIVGGVTVLVGALGLLTQIPGVNETMANGIDILKTIFLGLGSIVIPLGLLSAFVGVMGKFPVSMFAKGVADLGIITGSVTLVVGIIGGLSTIDGVKNAITTGISTIKEVVNSMGEIIVLLTLLTTYIGVVGALMVATGGTGYLAIIAGIGAFAEVIASLEILIVAIGGLNQIPGFKWLLQEGKTSLVFLGETLGEFGGSIIKAFAETAFSGLPQIGQYLADFIENAKPFFENISLIDESTTTGVKNLAEAMLMLTDQKIKNNLTQWFTGGIDMVSFGYELIRFAPYLKEYANIVSGIDGNVVENSSKVANSIIEFSKKIPNEGGMVTWFTGDNTLGKFATYLPTFGANLKEYSLNVRGIDTNVVENSAKSAESIAELAKKLPNQGGMASWFAGDNTLDVFSSYLPGFGKNLKSYADNIKGIDSNVLENTTKGAESIVELARTLPNEGGVASWFAGDNGIDKFGKKLQQFGAYFLGYYDLTAGVNVTKVISLSEAIKSIVNIFKDTKEIGKPMDEFSKKLSSVAKSVKDNFNTTFNYNAGETMGKNFGNGFANGLINTIKNKKFPSIKLTDKSTNDKFADYKISAYANGGLPAMGQLFVANERGAEFVGQLGGQTFVANQNQMMDLLDKKLGNTNKGQQVYNIYLDKDHKLGTYTLEQLQEIAVTNGEPITIG